MALCCRWLSLLRFCSLFPPLKWGARRKGHFSDGSLPLFPLWRSSCLCWLVRSLTAHLAGLVVVIPILSRAARCSFSVHRCSSSPAISSCFSSALLTYTWV